LELSQRPSPSAPEFLWVIKETLRRQGPDANAERDAAVSTPPHTTGANNNPPTEVEMIVSSSLYFVIYAHKANDNR
jgi:hypothetical protein